jgi:hypothetical protein
MFTCNENKYCYDHIHNTNKPTTNYLKYTKDELLKLKESQHRLKINNLKILYEKSTQIISSFEEEKYKDDTNELLLLNIEALKKLNELY